MLTWKKIKQNSTQAVRNLIAVKAQVLTRLEQKHSLGFKDYIFMKGKSDVKAKKWLVFWVKEGHLKLDVVLKVS